MPRYTVIKPFILPGGAVAAPGRGVELSARQAKYLLLSGKITPGGGDKQKGKKPAPDQKEN